MPASADTRTRAVNQVIWPFSASNKSVKSNVSYVKCHPAVRLTSFLEMYFFVAEQSCWWYLTKAIWPGPEFHRHTLNYSLVLLKAVEDVQPLLWGKQTLSTGLALCKWFPLPSKERIMLKKGLYTADSRVRIYTNSFQATSLNHSSSRACVWAFKGVNFFIWFSPLVAIMPSLTDIMLQAMFHV